jgi:Right handed beta helix region
MLPILLLLALDFREAIANRTGKVQLPPGVIELSSEIRLPDGSHDLAIYGDPAGTTIRLAANFQGRAAFVVRNSTDITIHDLTIDGNRAALAKPLGFPPSEVPFIDFYANNGVAAQNVDGLTISRIHFREIAAFAVIAAHSTRIDIHSNDVEDSGSRNAMHRNNSTGGVLIEEGSSNFQVRHCTFKNVLGNGVWTHARYKTPRNHDGVISDNSFTMLARDAIQVGHATRVTVENNTGDHIGYPFEEVDVETGGIPVGIDTAGDVDQTAYTANRFEETNGKCIDLDGFHDGSITKNVCINRGPVERYPQGNYAIVMNNSNPDMCSENITIADNELNGSKFGGIFLVGKLHKIYGNRLSNMNLAHCPETHPKFGCLYKGGEPDLLSAGIYLGLGAEHVDHARLNIIRNNTISGMGMNKRCIVEAPGISGNTIEANVCKQ